MAVAVMELVQVYLVHFFTNVAFKAENKLCLLSGREAQLYYAMKLKKNQSHRKMQLGQWREPGPV